MTLPARSDQLMETEDSTSNDNNSNNQENRSNKIRKKRKGIERSTKLTPEEIKEKRNLHSRLRLLKETPEQREKRLKKLKEYKESRTPEQKIASKLKNALYTRRYREEQLNQAKTQEERELLILKRIEYSRNYREKIKNLAKTPEEKEALRLKIVQQKRKSVEKLKNRVNKVNTIEQTKIHNGKEHTFVNEEMLLICDESKTLSSIRRNKSRGRHRISVQDRALEPINEQNNFRLLDFDEIKIENEVLQETTINTFPIHHQENFYHESWCWSKPSEKSYITEDIMKNHKHFISFSDASTSMPESFSNIKNNFTKIDRRKTRIKDSLCCMRLLIDGSIKRDGITNFGRHIAQKLRHSKKNAAEINIAKLLIGKVLENLRNGVYNSETQMLNKT